MVLQFVYLDPLKNTCLNICGNIYCNVKIDLWRISNPTVYPSTKFIFTESRPNVLN